MMHRITEDVLRRRLLTIALLILGMSNALAHDEFRVIGTLTKHSAGQIEVQNRDGKTTSIKLDGQTVITKDATKVDAAALTPGNSVVVDALGDSEADLLAIEIRIVPPIAPR